MPRLPTALLVGLALAATAASAAATPPIITGQVHGAWGIEANGNVVVIQMRASKLPSGSTLTITCVTRCKLTERLTAPKSGVVRSRTFGHRVTLVRGTVLEL